MSSSANQTTPPKHQSQIHVIVGAGAVGSAVARRLATQGHEVRIVSRSGSGPEAKNIKRIPLDASRSAELTRVCENATALYNCANPSYHQWATAWPPLASSILKAATQTGAVLATISNLYGYADPTKPMTESDPLRPSSKKGQIRADMWRAAKTANDSGLVRVTEARASDFVGPQVGANGHIGDRIIPKVLKGKPVAVLGDPDQAHSWTAIDDTARALVTLTENPQAWGRAWHVPTPPPQTSRQLIHRLCELAGVAPVKVRTLPNIALAVLGLFVADIRELKEVRYQFERPFVVDSKAFTREFGWSYTTLDDTLKAVLSHYQGHASTRQTQLV